MICASIKADSHQSNSATRENVIYDCIHCIYDCMCTIRIKR